jgi:outer membrane protein OmpA-like peptidoglycan-associated protein
VFGGQSSHSSNQFMHGPFVRVSYNFGAPPAMPVTAAPPPTGQPAMSKKSFIVFFDFDKSNITAEAQKTINNAAATAKSGNAAQVTLTGHTDRSGSEQYNLALSLRRAEAVKAAMIKQGVPASLIVVVGKGESQPLVPTADGVREPQNRRVEIVI